MAPSPDQVQRLVRARTASYSSAFERLDIDAVSSWQSKDIIFNDIALDEYEMDGSSSRKLLGEAFEAMKSLKVIESQTTGTLEFTTWEMLLEVEYGIDEPKLGIEKGKSAMIRGVSVLWWKWEGLGEWNGDVSEDGIKGWKIVREHDYMVPIKDGTDGGSVRILRS